MENITKRFGKVTANKDVTLELYKGEILSLLGENGSGKTTLMNMLSGIYFPDEGQIYIDGQPVTIASPKDAFALGIGMIHQHFKLVDVFTATENIILGMPGKLNLAEARKKVKEICDRYGFDIDPDQKIYDMSVSQKQTVEIVKVLYRGANILILDEPTAVLTPQESEALFATLAQMVAQGLSIIFISHKLGEVLRVSHRVAVLRQGKLVAEAPAQGTTQGQLAQWMVGHAIEAAERRPAKNVGDPICTLTNVSTAPAGRDRLNDVSLTLRAGEIVAIAGVSGNGQVALADVLCGVRSATTGQVTLRGAPLQAQPAWLVSQGVARIPEDRHAVGVVGDLPVWENAVSERLRGPWFAHPWFRAFWVKRRAARQHAQRVAETFDVRGGGADSPARSLSGGNMQKLILGRALMPPQDAAGKSPPPPQLIVAHQPTWGLDIGAVMFVQQQLVNARDAGAAVLLISDDLDEVLALGDRVAVMHDGQLSEACRAEDWTREAIGLAMAGATPTVRAEPVEALRGASTGSA